MHTVAVTPEGVRVVRGVFKMVDTHGLPLEVVLDRMKEQGMMPDWCDFRQAALSAGWNPKSLAVKLTEAVGDVYGPDFREGWTERYQKLSR